MSDEPHTCLVCSEDIGVFGAFVDCGHFLCHLCALRVMNFMAKPDPDAPAAQDAPAGAAAAAGRGGRNNNNGGRGGRRSAPVAAAPALIVSCPVCRAKVSRLLITEVLPPNEDQFEPATLKALIAGGALFRTDVKCYVTPDAASTIDLLVGFFCPLEQCWDRDPSTGAMSQDAFCNVNVLSDHLRIDHESQYCKLCREHRPAFLSEQLTYGTTGELEQHNRGKSRKDNTAFTGHPPCLFCSSRSYDGDHLLKHMQMQHVSCDLCNATEFSFVFYKNHGQLARHFATEHQLCSHKDCVDLEPILRVFASELELQRHMQRVHGESNRMDLGTLGFRFGLGDDGPSNNARQPRVAPAASAGGNEVANAASTHANKIYFDFINRMDEVNTTPAPSSAQQQQQAQSHQQQQGRGGRNSRNNQPPSAIGGGRPTDFVADEAQRKEANTQLKQALLRILGHKRIDSFMSVSGQFLNGTTLATEYFKQMQVLFPKKDDLEDVFEPLVRTLKDESRRAALIAAKTMLTSREAEKHREVAAEENEKKELDDMRKANAAARQQMRSGGKKKQTSSANAAAGAWNQRGGSAPAPPGGVPVSPPMLPARGGARAPTIGQWSGGSSAAAAAPPAPQQQALWQDMPAFGDLPSSGGGDIRSPTFQDPTDFPTLAPTQQRSYGRAAANGKKPTAWILGKKR